MKKIILLTTLLLTVFSQLFSQQFTNYTVSNTSKILPNNTVNAIAIDAQGNKWFGTDIGLSEFDGTNWTIYATANGLSLNIESIAIDAQGNKWIGTDYGGVFKFDGINWTNYTTANGLVNNNVRAIAIDAQGIKWFGTDNGVSKFDDSHWTTYNTANTANGLVNNRITSIAIDLQGNKWFGTNGYGVSKLTGTSWYTYNTYNSAFRSNTIKSISIDAMGNEWIGTDRSISKFDGTTWKDCTPAGYAFNSIASDSQGNIWCGTNFGVYMFNGTTWTRYINNIDNVYSIAIDAQGNKWVGTGASGVIYFDGTNSTTYTYADGLAGDDVMSIACDAEGNKWFGTIDYGVSMFNGTSWITYNKNNTNNGLAGNDVRSIACDAEGNKWFGTRDCGVSKFDGTKWTTYTYANGLVYNSVYAIAIDALGNKWFGTPSYGISMFDGSSSWTTYTRANTANGLVSNTITAIAIDLKGNKWFGTDSGISKFDGTNWTTYTNANTANGLANNYINSIAIDAQGNKWIATNSGLNMFDDSKWTIYTTANTANGLANNVVRSIAIDAQGNKWAGTNLGICMFNGTKWTTYNGTNNYWNTAFDIQGNKWFATSYGVLRFNGNSILSTNSINENVPANSTVGSLSTIDTDVTKTFTYSLVTGTGDTDNSSFNIDGSSLKITNRPDFETKNSYSILVRTSNQGSSSFDKVFTITINDVDEKPTVTNVKVTKTTSDEAVLEGTINANNLRSDVTIEYGTSTSYGNIFTGTPSQVTGTLATVVSFALSGLTSNTTYHFRVNADNSAGTTYGPDQTFTTTNPMILTFNTTLGTDNTVTLPLVGNLSSGTNVNVTVDWGDGTPTEIFNTWGYKDHTYSIGGTYTVSITGSLKGYGFYGVPINAEKLVSVTSFGNLLGLTNLFGAFYGATNLIAVPTSLPSGVTDLTITFKNATNFNGDISNWNVSNVTTMERMFENATNFNQDIGNWDVGNVKNMSDMFYFATKFNQNIRNWNVGKATNMEGMFGNVINFNCDISIWDVSNVTDMNNMFHNAPNFNQNIENWNVSKVTNMTAMFMAATNFNQNIGKWNVSNVTNMDAMFYGVTLSSTNYNSLLTKWATQTLKPYVTFDGGNSQYNSGTPAAARAVLTSSPNNWSITDGGMINEAPTNITLSATAINEKVTANTKVGTLSSTDTNAGNTFTYSLVTGTGDTDNASFNIDAENLRITNIPVYDVKSSYSIRIRTTDQGGLMYERVFTITINIPYAITTPTATTIKLTTATMGATITPVNAPVLDRGICWSTTSGVKETDNKTSEAGLTGGTFTLDVSGLDGGTTIYFKGYVTTAAGTILSEESSFSNIPVFTGTGNWDDAERWNLGVVPVLKFDTKISNIIIDGICTIEKQSLNDYAELAGILMIQNGAELTINASILIIDKLTINAGGKVIINPAQFFVTGEIANNAGTGGLVIKSDPLLTNVNFMYFAGTPLATVEMYSKASWNLGQPAGSRYNWQYFGIPVKTLSYSDAFNNCLVRKYNETSPDNAGLWSLQSKDSTLTSGIGYELCQSVPIKYMFKGELTNADFSETLPYTMDAKYPGQHILGNPYTTHIDISKIKFGANTEQSVYLYNTGTFNNWQSQSTTDGDAPGQYTVSTKSTAGNAGVPAVIPSMQGFLVKTTMDPGSISFSYLSDGLGDLIPEMQRAPKKIASQEKVITRIDVLSKHASDRMWIFTDPACTRKFDNGWDGYKMMGSVLNPQLFAMEADGDYQIDAVNNLNETYLGFQAGQDTEYTLKFTQQNIASTYGRVYLVDLLEGATTDITIDGSEYTFKAVSSPTPAKRFKLVTSTTGNIGTTNSSLLKVYSTPGVIYVENLSDQKGQLTLYDMKGVALKTMTFSANNLTSISTQDVLPGAYIGKAQTINQVTNEKLIIR